MTLRDLIGPLDLEHPDLARVDQQAAARRPDEATGPWGIRVTRVEPAIEAAAARPGRHMEQQIARGAHQASVDSGRLRPSVRPRIKKAEGVEQAAVLAASPSRRLRSCRPGGQKGADSGRGRSPGADPARAG